MNNNLGGARPRLFRGVASAWWLLGGLACLAAATWSAVGRDWTTAWVFTALSWAAFGLLRHVAVDNRLDDLQADLDRLLPTRGPQPHPDDQEWLFDLPEEHP